MYLNQKPKIIQSPSDIYGLLNQQISLRCDSSDLSDKITWIKDNTQIISNGNLLVIPLNPETEGQYQCNVSNSFGYSLSEKSNVKIAFLYNFSESNNSRKYVSPSTTVLLQCSAPEGLPKPKVEWKSNVSINNPRFKLDMNNNLRIDNIQRSDAGLYWCEAKNLVFTRLSSTIELIIFQKPVFLILPKHLQVMVSTHILFPCHVIGDSPMFIQWYKLGSSKNDDSLARTVLSTNCSMIINSVRLEDSGAYVCRARNSGGITEIIYKLSVISFPSFTETPENTRAKVGDSVFLRCSASGVPTPKVFWWHRNEYFLSDLDSNYRKIIYENGTLAISGVRPFDSGKYYCYAASFVGISRTETMLVVETPINMFAPVISRVPQNTTSVEGATVILTCRSPNPMVTVTWYKQSLRIVGDVSSRSRLQIVKDGDLKIVSAKLQDSAVYTCRIQSGRSLFTEKSASLTIKSYSDVAGGSEYLAGKQGDPPEPPRNVSTDFIGDTYLLVRWDYLHDDRSVGFRVEIAEQFINNWLEVTMTRQRTALVGGLRPDTGYMVAVRAINNSVIGDVAMAPDIVYTLDKPTIAADTSFAEFHKAFQELEVYSVKLAPISARQVQLSWRVKGNSILRTISGFIIKAERVSIRRCLLMSDRSAGSTPLFSCLENDEVIGGWDNLISGFDDTDDVRKEEQTSTKIQKSIVKRFISRERSRSSAIIGGLKPFSCYEIKVETFVDHIKAGRVSGRDSKTKTVLTFDDLPSHAPKIKSYRWIDNTTFQITWDSLNSRYSNGPVTGYIIQIVNLKKNSLQTFKIPMNILQYSFKTEFPELKYVLYLSADSCRGQGPRSWPVIIQYQEDQIFVSEFTLLQRPWFIASTISGISCGLFLTIAIILFLIWRKQRTAQQFPKSSQVPLVSSSKEIKENDLKMAAIQHLHQMQSQKLLSNYETISPDFELTSSDIFSVDNDPHSSTTTVPRFNCSSEDPNSTSKFDENKNDSLAYASSSIIYKGCQHYNLNIMNKFPPNFYGPYIDILNDPTNSHFQTSDAQLLGSPLIPPPPMYPPPPAPKNQSSCSDNNSEVLLSNQGSMNNTHSSESTSACGTNSNKSSKTRKSRTPQSVNSSTSSRSQKNNRKAGKSSDRIKDNSSPSIAGDKKKDSLSNSIHSSQQTGSVGFKTTSTNANGNKPGSRPYEQPSEIIGDTFSDQGMTSEFSESDTTGQDIDENARDTDSVRVMYKLPMKRPTTPDYSTDSSYAYSTANHYTSVDPKFPIYPNILPTKF